MIGQLDIVKARTYAENALKDKFSLQDFHYQVKISLNGLHTKTRQTSEGICTSLGPGPRNHGKSWNFVVAFSRTEVQESLAV